MCQVLVVAHRLLSCCMHAGSSSPTRYRTRAPCLASSESYPPDHQGSPQNASFLKDKVSIFVNFRLDVPIHFLN